ncbi:hypothetical protein QBC46DRAFT_419435 [Diplogelasinospora grovesii]|uniref:Uncharacterized protein n=1 Tax=Diplogelasinospora grovesii TaxID=303347 RepID=A0AAN6S0W3_9PEZI|nr:hypothetical protein QBC46DRAFT_419435 [Diplogelasinospora grovesii]
MRHLDADGALRTVTDKDDSFWGLKGARHNFGIVTSVTSKIYDVNQKSWAIVTLIFRGEKVEAIYAAANEYLTKNGMQPVDTGTTTPALTQTGRSLGFTSFKKAPLLSIRYRHSPSMTLEKKLRL